MGIKLETNNRNISRKAFNIWKRNNTLKKSISKKKKNNGENTKYSKINKNEICGLCLEQYLENYSTTFQYLRRKVSNHDLSFYLKKVENSEVYQK